MAPQTSRGVNNLLRRIEEMNTALQPTFVTVTWRSAFKVRRWLPPRPCAGVGSQWLLIPCIAGRESVAAYRHTGAA